MLKDTEIFLLSWCSNIDENFSILEKNHRPMQGLYLRKRL